MKQYFTGFFTGACLVASSVMFMGAQNKNLGDIEVRSISIKNSYGKQTVYLGSGVSGIGFLETYDADGKKTTYPGTGNHSGGNTVGAFGASPGDVKDGAVALFDRYGDIGWSASGKQ